MPAAMQRQQRARSVSVTGSPPIRLMAVRSLSLSYNVDDFSTEYIFHRVQTGRLSGQELGGVERSAGEAVAIERPVAQFQGLAQQGRK